MKELQENKPIYIKNLFRDSAHAPFSIKWDGVVRGAYDRMLNRVIWSESTLWGKILVEAARDSSGFAKEPEERRKKVKNGYPGKYMCGDMRWLHQHVGSNAANLAAYKNGIITKKGYVFRGRPTAVYVEDGVAYSSHRMEITVQDLVRVLDKQPTSARMLFVLVHYGQGVV